MVITGDHMIFSSTTDHALELHTTAAAKNGLFVRGLGTSGVGLYAHGALTGAVFANDSGSVGNGFKTSSNGTGDGWDSTSTSGDDIGAGIVTQIQAGLATSASITALDAVVDTVKAETVLILADTGELQTNQGNWLTVTGHATEAKQDVIDGEVGAIKAKTDSLAFTVAGHVDANTLKINGAGLVGDGNATPWDGA